MKKKKNIFIYFIRVEKEENCQAIRKVFKLPMLVDHRLALCARPRPAVVRLGVNGPQSSMVCP